MRCPWKLAQGMTERLWLTGKNVKEKPDPHLQLSNLLYVSQERFKVCICEHIQNLYNLPLPNNQGKCQLSSVASGTNTNLLGKGVVRTFWLGRKKKKKRFSCPLCFSYELHKATWWEAGQVSQTLHLASGSAVGSAFSTYPMLLERPPCILATYASPSGLGTPSILQLECF